MALEPAQSGDCGNLIMSAMSEQLCQYCSDTLHELMRTNENSAFRNKVPLTPNVCCICANLMKTAVPAPQSVDSLSPSGVSFEFYVWQSDFVELLVTASWYPLQIRDALTGFTVTPFSGRQRYWTQNLSADTLSQDALSFLRSKLAHCLETHADCHEHASTPDTKYPTRLLNLVARDPSKIMLVDTQNETRGHYFTLSHCWGDSQPLKLTRKSELVFRDGVDINILPKTFQHAIEVCRQMDIPYIWIDSMCIFQDDLTDWHAQARTMRQVYSLALCNIAATSAPSSSHGLRFHRKLNTMQPFTVVAPRQFWHEDVEGPSIRYTFYPNRYYNEYIRSGPLNKRAWVLQERLLSRRIMHFTSVGVYWECLNDCSSDLYPERLPRTRYGTAQDIKMSELKRVLSKVSKPDGKALEVAWTAAMYDGWNELCQRYSQCHLTVPSDKLVALNGIAQEISSRTGDSLVGGLWRRNLLPQLLWVQHHNRGDNWTIHEWRAPSWSWVQHDATAVYFTHLPCEGGRERATVEHLDVGTAPSGQLQHASLVLRGRLVRADLIVDDVPPQSRGFFRFFNNRNTEMSPQIMENLYLDFPHKQQYYHAQIVCIAVYEDTCTLGLGYSNGSNEGRLGVLVLKECCPQPIKYERIGVIFLEHEYCELYNSLESPQEHSITII